MSKTLKDKEANIQEKKPKRDWLYDDLCAACDGTGSIDVAHIHDHSDHIEYTIQQCPICNGRGYYKE